MLPFILLVDLVLLIPTIQAITFTRNKNIYRNKCSDMIAWNFLLCLKLLLGWTGKKASFLLCFYRQRFLLNNVTFHDSKLSMFSWHSRSILVLYLNTGNSHAETIEAKNCKNNNNQIWNIHRAAAPSSGIALLEIRGNLELGKPKTCLVLCNRYCKNIVCTVGAFFLRLHH